MEEVENFQDFKVAKPDPSMKPVTNVDSKEKEEACWPLLPVGYRFKPLDHELLHYLNRKINNQPLHLPPNIIVDVQLYNYDPDTLTKMSKNNMSNGVFDVWYFFTPRDKKYRNGTRPKRAAGDGFWKATGADKPVLFKGNKVGSKKTLVYLKGKPPKGEKKTNWIMHELLLSNPGATEGSSNGGGDMLLNKWVVCRLYKKEKVVKSEPVQGNNEVPKQESGKIPSPQIHDHNDQQCQVEQNFNMLPVPPTPQNCQIPIYNYASDDSFIYGELPKLPESLEYLIHEHDTTIYSHQPTMADFGIFEPQILPMPSIPPPYQVPYMYNANFSIYQQQHEQNLSDVSNNLDIPMPSVAPPNQVHYMDHANFNIYQQHQQQQNISGVSNNLDSSAVDGFIL